MKNTFRLFIFLLFTFLVILPVQADRSESVRVIKFDKQKNDLIVERRDGERLLLQHNRMCSSMSTEYPVSIIWDNNKNIKELKIAFNERCKVYNFGEYTGDLKIDKRILSENLLIKEHEAEITFKESRYKIDYEEGCVYMREFVGKNVYINSDNNKLKGGTIYLPGNRGQCIIKNAELLETIDNEKEKIDPVAGLQYQAQNNRVYFYWEKSDIENPLYLISHSRYEINTNDYTWKQMPKLRYSRRNSYTVMGLANDMTYHFYIAVIGLDKSISEWKHIELTPKNTTFVFKNNPDPEEFEIEIKEETDEYYLLEWPNKENNSKRYILQFFVNGKRTVFKYLKSYQNQFKIMKKPEYEGKRFRLMIRTLPIKRFGARYSDGIYWENKK